MLESNKRPLFFFLLCLSYLTAILLAYQPVKFILSDPRIDLYYTHIPIIPLISGVLLLRERKKYFSDQTPSPLPGIAITIVSISLYILAMRSLSKTEYSVGLALFSAILFFAGMLITLYGFKSFKMAFFSIAFLLLAIPVPESLMDKVVTEIASSSVHITDLLFNLIGIPYVRQGIEIYLPGYILVVGPECAGWRSSIALLTISFLAGHIFLKKFGHKILLVALAIPMIIIKNGTRIVVLYLIAYFVDERFMEPGFIHRSVGYGMFIIVLILMGLILWSLEKKELRESENIKNRSPD
ncbi:MAG: exosortase/archaeosortase family protein [Tepidanaerobacteraceae bacterium]|jgi:exosortase|nr:exosortase/archaeosortase family protein [Tepidanaerobacteraceae bacterium]